MWVCVLKRRAQARYDGGKLIHLSNWSNWFDRARKERMCHLFSSPNSSAVICPTDELLYLTEAKLLWELGRHVLIFRGSLVKLANFQMEIKSLFARIKMFLGCDKVLTAKTSLLMVQDQNYVPLVRSDLIIQLPESTSPEIQNSQKLRPQKFSLHFHSSNFF